MVRRGGAKQRKEQKSDQRQLSSSAARAERAARLAAERERLRLAARAASTPAQTAMAAVAVAESAIEAVATLEEEAAVAVAESATPVTAIETEAAVAVAELAIPVTTIETEVAVAVAESAKPVTAIEVEAAIPVAMLEEEEAADTVAESAKPVTAIETETAIPVAMLEEEEADTVAESAKPVTAIETETAIPVATIETEVAVPVAEAATQLVNVEMAQAEAAQPTHRIDFDEFSIQRDDTMGSKWYSVWAGGNTMWEPQASFGFNAQLYTIIGVAIGDPMCHAQTILTEAQTHSLLRMFRVTKEQTPQNPIIYMISRRLRQLAFDEEPLDKKLTAGKLSWLLHTLDLDDGQFHNSFIYANNRCRFFMSLYREMNGYLTESSFFNLTRDVRRVMFASTDDATVRAFANDMSSTPTAFKRFEEMILIGANSLLRLRQRLSAESLREILEAAVRGSTNVSASLKRRSEVSWSTQFADDISSDERPLKRSR